MPQYRYAIGQAPIRFPSTAREKTQRPTTAGSQQIGTEGSKSASVLKTNGAQRKNQRTHQSARSATNECDNPSNDSQKLFVPPPAASRSSSPGPTSSPMLSSRSSSSVISCPSLPSEKSRLSAKTGDAHHRQPTSTTPLLRPKSFFWSEAEAQRREVQADSATGQPARPKSSYGALEGNCDPVNEADPYGYRALAGPALLPSFHEQQQQKVLGQRQAEERKRYSVVGRLVPLGAGLYWNAGAVFALLVVIWIIIYRYAWS